MIIEIDDWKFDVDMTATMAHSAAEAADHCECGYCRNFYAAVDGAYPELRPFLARFGLDIEGPEQLSPFEPTLFLADYRVNGQILSYGSMPLRVAGVSVDAQEGEGTLGSAFNLSVGLIELPWVLAEPMEEVVSPANEPSFLQKMRERLLSLLPTDNTKQ